MAVRSSKTQEKGNVGAPIIAVAILALIALLIWLGYRSFGPSGKPLEFTNISAEDKANNAWIAQKAKESGGDMSKLSAEDVARLQQITRGMGAMALKSSLKSQ